MKNEPKKVLYIEDDLPSRKLVKKILSSSPFQFFEAANGMEGLKKAEEVVPDLIIMDINLPDINGRELATKIKNHSDLEDTIIVALTGFKEAESRELSLIAGCDGYLSKPIDVDNFLNQLSKFLKGKRESIAEEKKETVRRKYQEKLVDDLTEKIKQLQQANSQLNEKTGKLREYSGKLELLMQVIYKLQLCQSARELKKNLISAICKKFEFERCAILEVDTEQMLLKTTDSYGFKENELKNLKIRYNAPFFQKLFKEKQILFFPGLNKNLDERIKDALTKIGTSQFIFCILGTPSQKTLQLSVHDDLQTMLSNLIPTLYDQKETDIDIIREHLREFLASDIFYFGGYLFIDHSNSDKIITSYDVRILEMLIQTAGLLYQNLRLREQLKKLFVRAEKDAITDHLTNLFNFRYFTQQLIRELNRAQRHHSHFVLLMLDIDFFKQYNDTFGHQAGDLVLQRLAKLLLQNTRSSDFVARYGGEEFVIICPELDRSSGKKLAEKLCRIIAKSPFPLEEKLPHKKVTISIGVAVFPEDSKSASELIHNADLALYAAKNNGRNQVALYQHQVD